MNDDTWFLLGVASQQASDTMQMCSLLQRLHGLTLDGEPLLVTREELRETLHVTRVGLDGLADALGDPLVEIVG